MPRVYASDNSPLDFCQKHFPKTEEEAQERFGDVGAGPDGRLCFAYDADHPDYSGLGYRCYDCRKTLNNKDNHTKVKKGTKP